MNGKRQYRDFEEPLWRGIQKKLETAIEALDGPHYAAFDADGTLWNTDIGESFFQFQQDHQLVELPENPWEHYRTLKTTVHPTSGYLWLAQINKGLKEETLNQHCNDHLDAIEPIEVLPAQKRLVDWLHSKGVEVFVVTASIKWPVAAAAKRHFDIDEDHVIGVEVAVDNGIVTDQQKGDVTYREGKKKRLLEATNSRVPILSSGNTPGDEHLIECASEVQLAVSSANEDSHFYPEEMKLRDLAEKRGWLTHRF